jgi:hypothetical protein
MTRPTVAPAPSHDETDSAQARSIVRLAAYSGFYLVTAVAATGAAFAVQGTVAERPAGPIALLPLLATFLVIGVGGALARHVVPYVLARCPLFVRRRL